MRAASRLLASVRSARVLDSGQPTGLTGLLTHRSPHSTLLYLYASTLDKLQEFPQDSVYRQATESLTKHRLEIVQKVKPAGFDEWRERHDKLLAAKVALSGTPGGEMRQAGGNWFLSAKAEEEYDEDVVEWDGEDDTPALEGSRTAEERKNQHIALGQGKHPEENEDTRVKIEPEPRYTIEQVEHLEAELKAGLLEEVIQVAEGENELVDAMVKAKVWEELEIKAPDGQWAYFERKAQA